MTRPPSTRPDRTAELHRLLLETEDDQLRARAHLELAGIAMQKRRMDIAIRHLREALLLDPRLETARNALRSMGSAPPSEDATRPGRRARLKAALSRWAGRDGPGRPPNAF